MQPGDHMWLICEQFHGCVCPWPLSFHCGKCLTAWSVILLPVACARSYQNFPQWIDRYICFTLILLVCTMAYSGSHKPPISWWVCPTVLTSCWLAIGLYSSWGQQLYMLSIIVDSKKKSAAKLQVPVFNCSEKTYKYNFACFSYCGVIHLRD